MEYFNVKSLKRNGKVWGRPDDVTDWPKIRFLNGQSLLIYSLEATLVDPFLSPRTRSRHDFQVLVSLKSARTSMFVREDWD